MTLERGQLIIDGKTKSIWEHPDDSNLVIAGNKDAITAHNDPEFTQEFASKGICATDTTCRVFELLRDTGIPVAFQEQLSTAEFLARRCQMIALEVVARRYAVGSYLERHPDLAVPEGETPHRFHQLVTEFFLKTTDGKLIASDDAVLVEGLTKKTDDPFISNPYDSEWNLVHPKKPAWDPDAALNKRVEMGDVVNAIPGFQPIDLMKQMEDLLRRVFLVLEGAWKTLGVRLIDLKIEFGIDADGKLLVADVIDNDSWRIRDHNWREMSKENFRQGADLKDVEKDYQLVRSLVGQFQIPHQVIVTWRGSDKDEEFRLHPHGDHSISHKDVVLSGHKSPQACLAHLEQLLAEYPGGGVIIVKVGRSNGLGPLLAARTSWPVITFPATAKDFPDDFWSSLRMPSDVPLMTAWPEQNAILAAINILAQSNPALYMQRQLQLEKLDQ